jgi:hypothetical protein
MPPLFQRIYQSVFTSMYLMSAILNTPPPPNDLLHSDKQAAPIEGVSVEVGAGATEEADGVSIQAATEPGEKGEATVSSKA